MKLPVLKDAIVRGKRVLLRCDLNTPLTPDGKVQDNTRIKESLPTIKFLLENGARLIVLSHLGRPDGKVVESLRLNPVADELSVLLGSSVKKLDSCLDALDEVMALNDGEICLLENTRFYPGEEENDPLFTEKLARLGEIYVNDAFGTVHRAHSSTSGLAAFLPSYAGLLLEKEINVLSKLLEEPKRPMCLITGGAKIGTKIGILENFLPIADYFLIGGALANTFLAAQGVSIGSSMCENEKISVAKNFLDKSNDKIVILPSDVIVSKDVSKDAVARNINLDSIDHNDKILDIGINTVSKFLEAISKSATVIWNGPLGLYEFPQFANGTHAVADALAKSNVTTIIGGGDTIDAINNFSIPLEKFSHISTGGGAMLEFLEGKELPGIHALMAK